MNILCIVHSSLAYVDAYEYGIRCLKYNSKVNFLIAVKEDEFSTGQELEKILEQWDAKTEAERAEYITSIRRKYAGKWEDGIIRKVVERLLV